jgi:hypothetical protein
LNYYHQVYDSEYLAANLTASSDVCFAIQPKA